MSVLRSRRVPSSHFLDVNIQKRSRLTGTPTNTHAGIGKPSQVPCSAMVRLFHCGTEAYFLVFRRRIVPVSYDAVHL